MGDRGGRRPGGVRRLGRRTVRGRLSTAVGRCVDVSGRGALHELVRDTDREPDRTKSLRFGLRTLIPEEL
ncbi:hypothetical protein ACFYZ2_15320 [Streptomyces sviceus]|uniref:hypothetical protein n=1 Tax=Streptomyces sviceus TaxID=285530 RepID=UPI00368B0928